MIKWEYKCEQFLEVLTAEALNALGEYGWEVVYVSERQMSFDIMFKRPIPDVE